MVRMANGGEDIDRAVTLLRRRRLIAVKFLPYGIVPPPSC